MINWFFNLDDAPQATFASGTLSATVSFLAMLVAIGMAIISRRQANTSQQVLFASLLEKRIKWLAEFTAAVRSRDKEIANIPPGGLDHYIASILTNTPTAPALLSDAIRSSHWLFDTSVADIATRLGDLLEKKCELMITARMTPETEPGKIDATAFKAARDVSAVSMELETQLELLSLIVQPFMYVGDVKRPSSVTKAAPKLKGRIIKPERGPSRFELALAVLKGEVQSVDDKQ